MTEVIGGTEKIIDIGSTRIGATFLHLFDAAACGGTADVSIELFTVNSAVTVHADSSGGGGLTEKTYTAGADKLGLQVTVK